MKRAIRWLLEPFAKLYRKFFDPRFYKVEVGLEELSQFQAASNARAEQRFEATAETNSELVAFLGHQLRRVSDQLDGMADDVGNLVTKGRDSAEELNTVRHELASLVQPVDAIDAKVDELLGRITSDLSSTKAAEDLTPEQAAFLSFAESHQGFRSQAGLWFNPPVTVDYQAGKVSVGSVNERIVEVPFALGAVASLDSGSSILDVGCAESHIAYSLASLGFRVTGIDLHPYPLRHANLNTVAAPLQEWQGPAEPFDGVVCLSAIEHFGLGAYGEPDIDPNLDEDAMRRLLDMTRPGGLLVFTAPFGQYRVEDHQRVYDLDALERLLKGWEVEDLRLAARDEKGAWRVLGGADRASDLTDASLHAVVLISAKKAG